MTDHTPPLHDTSRTPPRADDKESAAGRRCGAGLIAYRRSWTLLRERCGHCG